MNKLSFKTLLASLIGTGIAGGLATLPVRANADNLAAATADPEVILSQINYRDRSDNEPSEGWKNIVGLTGLAIGAGVIGYQVNKAYNPSFANSLPNVNHQRGTTLITRVSPKLRRELLRLVHNQATANRLLSGTANSHPGRSANWVAEKVIYDLKRDR